MNILIIEIYLFNEKQREAKMRGMILLDGLQEVVSRLMVDLPRPRESRLKNDVVALNQLRNLRVTDLESGGERNLGTAMKVYLRAAMKV